MTNIPLKSKVSSLFEMPDKGEIPHHGSSVTSYAWEPHDEGRKTKKVENEAILVREKRAP